MNLPNSSNVSPGAGGEAYQMAIRDPSLQAYLQRYPFCAGPDKELNRRGRSAVFEHFRARSCSADVDVVRVPSAETGLSEDAIVRVTQLFDVLEIPSSERMNIIDDFNWEVGLVPGVPRHILVIGCGGGTELLFLRGAFPNAKIVAMDYHNSVGPKMAEIIQFSFLEGDLNLRLNELPESNFDLIFSNHTMEHFYTPDEVLAKLCTLLVSGGHIVSTLPLDASPGSPFLDRVSALADAHALHPMDVVYLDPGHPWKATVGDLRSTLERAGFASVEVFQRLDHLSRPFAGSLERFESRRIAKLRWYAATFGLVRSVLRGLFPVMMPDMLLRALLAVERRSGIGANDIKNQFTEEALFRATKP